MMKLAAQRSRAEFPTLGDLGEVDTFDQEREPF